MVRKNVAAVGGAMAGLVEEEMTTSTTHRILE
jgi:hypothetical protein